MSPTNFRGMGFKLSHLKVTDFKAAREIFTLCFTDTPIRDFHYAWRNRIRGVKGSLGIYKKDDLVGFLLSDVGGYKYKNTHIAFLAIHPLYQKFRLGSCILETFLKNECEERRNITLTPLYTEHVWNWYHRQGFYVTKYSKALDGGTFTLMNFHHYPTRRNNRHLWFSSLLPTGDMSERYVL